MEAAGIAGFVLIPSYMLSWDVLGMKKGAGEGSSW
jgi:hypothetical protein